MQAKICDGSNTAAPVEIDGANLEVGIRLEVKFDDGVWYPGSIEEKLDEHCKFRVFYDDGQREDIVIKRVPSDDVRAVRQSDFNIRVWKTLLSMTGKTSSVVAQHEAAREGRRKRASEMPETVRDLFWQVVWAKQKGFTVAWPSLVVVRTIFINMHLVPGY